MTDLSTLVMNIDGGNIAGESIRAGHQNDIDVWLIHLGASTPMAGHTAATARTTGRCKHDDFVCWMPVSSAFPKLVEACHGAKSFDQVKTYALKKTAGGSNEVMCITLGNVYISKVSLVHPNETPLGDSAPETAGGLVVQLALNYKTIEISYNQHGLSGSAAGNLSSSTLDTWEQ